MGEFFKGWRRKAGLVMLAMAMLLTVAWLRSYVVTDDILIRHHRDRHAIRSMVGRVSWYYDQLSTPHASSFSWDATETEFWLSLDEDGMLVQHGIPYWLIVLLLTLLSAWLILGKWRKAKGVATGQ